MGKQQDHPVRPDHRWLLWGAPLTALVTASIPTYIWQVRPWMLRWGATDVELAAALPGDALIPQPRHVWMRAVTIAAPPAAVWPWLAQMGQGRGGLYSYDWLENLIGCDIHSADQILPAYQDLAVGDTVRLVREDYPAPLLLRVAIVEPGRALVLRTPEPPGSTPPDGYPSMSWAFVLDPTPTGGTRLITRTRSDYAPTLASRLVNQIMLEPIQFIMERKMLLGIRARAERLAASAETVIA